MCIPNLIIVIIYLCSTLVVIRSYTCFKSLHIHILSSSLVTVILISSFFFFPFCWLIYSFLNLCLWNLHLDLFHKISFNYWQSFTFHYKQFGRYHSWPILYINLKEPSFERMNSLQSFFSYWQIVLVKFCVPLKNKILSTHGGIFTSLSLSLQ